MGCVKKLNLLFDTHVLLWSLLEPERLSDTICKLIVAESSQIWVSPITTWECHLLSEKGKVTLLPDPQQWLKQAFQLIGAREAPVTHEVARVSRALQLAHQDPADRFLAATASVYKLTLVTADARLLGASGYSWLSAVS